MLCKKAPNTKKPVLNNGPLMYLEVKRLASGKLLGQVGPVSFSRQGVLPNERNCPACMRKRSSMGGREEMNLKN